MNNAKVMAVKDARIELLMMRTLGRLGLFPAGNTLTLDKRYVKRTVLSDEWGAGYVTVKLFKNDYVEVEDEFGTNNMGIWVKAMSV